MKPAAFPFGGVGESPYLCLAMLLYIVVIFKVSRLCRETRAVFCVEKGVVQHKIGAKEKNRIFS